jgi:hypothetical protein
MLARCLAPVPGSVRASGHVVCSKCPRAELNADGRVVARFFAASGIAIDVDVGGGERRSHSRAEQ